MPKGPRHCRKKFVNFYTHHSILKRARKIMPKGPRHCRKKFVTFLRGGGGGHDVSCKQNRYVTLPLHVSFLYAGLTVLCI